MTTHNFAQGDKASYTKTITAKEIEAFALLSGDDNPLHLDENYANRTRFQGRIAHGMLTASLISTVIGTKLPGPGAIYLGQELKFLKPVMIGDTITATATVTSYNEVKHLLVLLTECSNQRGEIVITGEAKVRYEPIA